MILCPKRSGLATLILLIGGLSYTTVFASDLQETDSYEKQISFSQPNQEKTFEIDNVFGAITVTGYTGETIQMEVVQTLFADDREKMSEAIQSTRLAITEKNNHIVAYAEAPYRNWNRHRSHNFGFYAKYDLVVKVPYETNLILKTVNDGNIRVQDMIGNFEINNVNGSIHMERVEGPCQAHTVNGPVFVSFNNVPEGDCDFKTINGDLTLAFPSEPHGDYRLKTFNGEMYSDYSFTTLPSKPVTRSKRGGLTKIKTDGFVGVRIGAGGPEFKMDTLNGDIIIRNN